MYSEIGSEFWQYSSNEVSNYQIPQWLHWGKENRLLASGRAALDHIICDIKSTRMFKTVYMPSYCCQSMIEPFISNEVEVLFYDVVLNQNGGLHYNIDYNINCDVVFIMSYFGYSSDDVSEIVEIFKNKRGKVVIEDATHSLFQIKAFNMNSDYVLASFRKWMAIPGGALASKMNNVFNIDLLTMIHGEYVNLRVKGMRLKDLYISYRQIDKKSFLQIFKDAEKILDKHYKGYTIDNLSLSIINEIDINEIRSKRIENANYLLEGFSTNLNINPLYKSINMSDCPLFLPIIIRSGSRDIFKKHLSENNVYCPIHWPKSELHKLNKKSEFIYDHILSIICDQRYSHGDMNRIIEILRDPKIGLKC